MRNKKIIKKAAILRKYTDANTDTLFIGETNVWDFSEDLFNEAIKTHNRNIDLIKSEFSKNCDDTSFELKLRLNKIKIPTYEVFISELSDKDSRGEIAAHMRSNKFKNYKKWLKVYHRELVELFLNSRIFFQVPINKHLWCTAKTRGGKTETLKQLIYANMLNKRQPSIIILDFHGDMAREVGRFNEFIKKSESLVYIYPFLKKGFIPSLGCFEIEESEKTDQNISMLTDQYIFSVFEKLMGSEFSNHARTCLRYTIPLILRHGGTLFDLKRFMIESENSDLLKLGLRSPNKQTRNYFEHDFQSSNLKSTKSSLAAKISSYLANSTFSNLINRKKSFSLEDLMNSPGKVIVFNLAKGKLGQEVATAYGLFILSMIVYYGFKRERLPKHLRPHTVLFIDEAHNLLTNTINELLSELGKYHLFFGGIAHQYPRQLPSDIRTALYQNSQIKSFGYDDNDPERKHLRAGQFIFTMNGVSVKVQVKDDLLGFKNCMSKEEWQKVKESQVKKYYTEINPNKIGDCQAGENISTPQYDSSFEIDLSGIIKLEEVT